MSEGLHSSPSLASCCYLASVLPCQQVVNKQESDKVEQLGCPFVAVNLSVGLSLSMPSIALKIAGT
jgi:hypothetical protein